MVNVCWPRFGISGRRDRSETSIFGGLEVSVVQDMIPLRSGGFARTMQPAFEQYARPGKQAVCWADRIARLAGCGGSFPA